jgi:hypothetical protein
MLPLLLPAVKPRWKSDSATVTSSLRSRLSFVIPVMAAGSKPG